MNVVEFKKKSNSEKGHSSRNKSRLLKDALFGAFMGVGGVSVIGAILLIFFYLGYVVIPLFAPAKVEFSTGFNIDPNTKILASSIDEYSEVIFSVHADGSLVFSSVSGKNSLSKEFVAGKKTLENKITAVSSGDPESGVMVIGTENGEAYLLKPNYEISYPKDVRKITPSIVYPAGKLPLKIDKSNQPILKISGQFTDENGAIASVTSDNRLLVTYISASSSFLSDELDISYETVEVANIINSVSSLKLDVNQRTLVLVTSDGVMSMYDVAFKENIELIDRVSVVSGKGKVTDMTFLSSGLSIIVGSSSGAISQWASVRDINNIYSIESWLTRLASKQC